MDKIRVVNVITDINIGGAGKVLENYLAYYNKSEFELSVILPEKSSLADILGKYEANIIPSNNLKGVSYDRKSILPMFRLFKKIKPDIVHTHASLSSRIAAKLYGQCKIIYTRHCIYPPSKFMRSIPGRLLGRVTADMFSDAIIAISPAARQNLIDTGVPANKIKVFMNGVKPLKKLSSEEKATVRKKYGIKEKDKIVGMVGRLEPVKGHTYFLKAAGICLQKDKNMKFIIVGKGAIEEELIHQTKKTGIAGSVIFTGFLDDVAPVMNVMDVFVNASYGTEASSLAMLEAMSLGKPVVAADYGGNPYQVKHNETGLIVPVKDAQAIADAVMTVIEDDGKFSKNTFLEYKEKYTAEAMCENIETVYREMSCRELPIGKRRKDKREKIN